MIARQRAACCSGSGSQDPSGQIGAVPETSTRSPTRRARQKPTWPSNWEPELTRWRADTRSSYERLRRPLEEAPPPLCEHRLELGLEARLRPGADQTGGDLTVLEDDHRRDREDLVLRGGLRVLVGVQAHDPQILALGVDLLEDRMNHTTRPAPGSPEVDQHGTVGLEHFGLEGGVGHIVELARHGRSPRLRFVDARVRESATRFMK